MLSIFNFKLQFLEFFGIQKLFRLVYFFDKKYSKKIFRLDFLISFFTQATYSRKKFFFTFVNFFLLQILEVLRSIGFLLDFFLVPKSLFSSTLVFSSTLPFEQRLVLVYLNKNITMGATFQTVTLFSKPSRQIYVSYRQLKNCYVRLVEGQKVFVLSTIFGIITHTEVLKKKIGGTLLLVV